MKHTYIRFAVPFNGGPPSRINVGEFNEFEYHTPTGIVVSTRLKTLGQIVGSAKITGQAPGPMWGDYQTTAYTIETDLP